MENREMFEAWASQVQDKYSKKQWLLSRWESCDGLDWPPEKIHQLLSQIARGLDLNKQHVLLDLGCGGGWIGQGLGPLCRKVIGLDYSQQMLKNAKKVDPEGRYLCGDILHLPFSKESADRILCYFVLLNFMDDQNVLSAFREIWRVLKNGGKALIGQLPDKTMSAQYDVAKQEYLGYAQKHYCLGASHREEFRFPQKLFDRQNLENALRNAGIPFSTRESFNPFFRPGASPTVPWRFDVILSKN